jgi:hypothetical protein
MVRRLAQASALPLASDREIFLGESEMAFIDGLEGRHVVSAYARRVKRVPAVALLPAAHKARRRTPSGHHGGAPMTLARSTNMHSCITGGRSIARVRHPLQVRALVVDLPVHALQSQSFASGISSPSKGVGAQCVVVGERFGDEVATLAQDEALEGARLRVDEPVLGDTEIRVPAKLRQAVVALARRETISTTRSGRPRTRPLS